MKNVRSKFLSLTASLAAIGISSAVFAQDGAPVAPPGGGPGFRGGGRQGGMRGMRGGNESLMSILQRTDVSAELNLTAEELEGIKAISDAQRAMPRSNFGGRPPDPEAMAQMQKDLQKRPAEADSKVRALLNSNQARRADEILVQRLGFLAILHKDVAAKLLLTDVQGAKI